ncbi:SDR family NAD(P)-dependent oxidoreductase [Methylobacterium nodulans]|uniref:Short-chain dehydrogenase/reductase SDR n=1 Tax=Methylobacterium nodulans (strain LMG 21967 / CNCM I-2342 / ORS 2060) TaxID=460265 RepID=B8IBP0_METNO|nr:SDR family oxidoreductase [Methylobacterium nodulans]ACL59294.1 short-chain dehydrogenase/reductase SDR [Methylobacterium nodulans ORS 2060]
MPRGAGLSAARNCARNWTLVTGASSGIGAALARAFAARGHALVLSARRTERLQALAGELSGAVPVEVIPADLTDPSAPDRLMEAVASRGIALHTLVNNAGFGMRGRFATLPADELMDMVAVNVAAPTALARRVLPDLIARREGGILNVASVGAYLPGPKMAVYYATKAYLLSLSEALFEEAKPHGVTVTALCPGVTDSEFAARADREGTKRFNGRGMAAEEVARIGLMGYLRGEAVVVPGSRNRLIVAGLQLLPRRLTRKVANRLQSVPESSPVQR